MSLNIISWQPNLKDAINSGVVLMQEIYDIARNSMSDVGGNTRDKGLDCLAAYGFGLVGALQKETNTIDAPAGASTNIAVTVTDPNTPALAGGKTINVAVLNADTANTVAAKIAAALALDADVTANWTPQSLGANYWIEAKTPYTTVAGVNIGHGAITGISASANSTTETQGVAPINSQQVLDCSAKFSRVVGVVAKDLAGNLVESLNVLHLDPANPAKIYVNGYFESATNEYLLNVYGELKPR